MYSIYRAKINSKGSEIVQAQLVDPAPRELKALYSGNGFSDPMQFEPYGVDFNLTFEIDPKYPMMDNYYQGAGFDLYSLQLVELLIEFGVKFEDFPAKLIEAETGHLVKAEYRVFHLLEEVISAIDEGASNFTLEPSPRVDRLVLDLNRFEHRPMFYCDKLFIPLMRLDLKEEIEQRGISGFEFTPLDQYKA